MGIAINFLLIFGLIVLAFFITLAAITIFVFFLFRKKYYHYREIWRDRKNFFTVVIFPFIDWIFNAWVYAEKGGEYTKPLYHYEPKQFFLTKPEHDCFNALITAVGNEYYIFPQVKLDKFLDEHTKGQGWTAALRHINQKSVDFLLCDKIWLNPKLAIELDDSTHDRSDRIDRDHEIERILRDANFPLLRITHFDISSPVSIKQKINIFLP